MGCRKETIYAVHKKKEAIILVSVQRKSTNIISVSEGEVLKENSFLMKYGCRLNDNPRLESPLSHITFYSTRDYQLLSDSLHAVCGPTEHFDFPDSLERLFI